MKWNESDVPKMSPPPPLTLHVPLDSVWLPGPGDTWPMSVHVHVFGHAPGGGSSVALSPTVSSVTADEMPWLCEVTAMPASSGPVIGSTWVDPGTAVQLVP